MKKIINPTLSVIIIVKNEEKYIEKCIKSVLYATREIKKEIILVDSASTDNTLTKAKKFDINIISLRKDKELSPSVGRFIGANNASGDYILFLDGDQELCSSWFKLAFREIKLEEYSALYGKYNHLKYNAKTNCKNNFKTLHLKESRELVGTFLIKKEDLLQSDNFNPSMKGEEEKELAYRLMDMGFKIGYSEEVMAIHHLKEQEIPELKERLNYFTGFGQLFRKNLFKKNIFLILKQRPYHLFLISLDVIILLALLSKNLLIISLSLLFPVFLIIIKDKLKIDKESLYMLIKILLLFPSFLKGLFIFDKPKEYYLNLVMNNSKK